MKKPEVNFRQLFINNEFVDAVSGKTFPTIDLIQATKKSFAKWLKVTKQTLTKLSLQPNPHLNSDQHGEPWMLLNVEN